MWPVVKKYLGTSVLEDEVKTSYVITELFGIFVKSL
jgi:hypothetical protein